MASRKNICIHLFIMVSLAAYILTVPSSVLSSAPSSKIKVLIIDENSSAIPDKDEKLVRLGNTMGDLFMSGNHYSGDIEVWKGEKGLYIINELPLEEYVESVVAAEVGTSWDIEALKAQAVIARTYAVFKKNANVNLKYHLTSSVLHQAYKGKNSNIKVAYAVRNTAGEIITYEGKPIEAFYHSTCGGRTENPEDVFGKSYPYLKSVESKCEISPYWIWERKIPMAEIETALNIKDIKDISINSNTSTGRVKDLSVKSQSGSEVVKATELRRLLGWSRLPSTNFTIRMTGGYALFEGKGYGHGVGLCQWSALQMAREGKTYKEILSFFYPNTEINIYEGE